MQAPQQRLMCDGTHDASAVAAAAMIEHQVQMLQTSKTAEIDMEIWKNDRGGQQLKGQAHEVLQLPAKQRMQGDLNSRTV